MIFKCYYVLSSQGSPREPEVQNHLDLPVHISIVRALYPNLKRILVSIFFNWRIVIYNIVLVSGVQQSDSVLCIYIFFRFFTHIGYNRILIDFSIYRSMCMSIPSSQFIPQQPICFLCLWLCFCFINKFICIIFKIRFYM